MQVALTIDMEHDCPPFLNSYRGIEEGAPRLLDLLEDEGVEATFFTTGDVARRYPEILQRITRFGHEPACHGDTHRRFSTMDEKEARKEIETSTQCLRAYGDITSFRAPNLDFPEKYLPLLKEYGYTVDSSQAAYKFHKGHPRRPTIYRGMVRFPVSTTPSAIRLPAVLRNFILWQKKDPIVLFFHPWEFVDVTREAIPWDCRFRTGQPALDTLRAAIKYLRSRQAAFVTMNRLAQSAGHRDE
ncbi:MAG: polysaccharide deacetylase family protein [Fimbriimonadaceae bacterium]|nr:polysaccharide deacetylase family protein [Alphaproteobacteria bacterium]